MALKAIFVQVIWKYRIGLHQNDGVSTDLASR